MIKKILKVAFVVAIAIVAVINVYYAQKTEVLSDVAMANVEALASGESGTDCVDVYDVKDYHLTYVQREGHFTVDMAGEITILGKKFSAGGLSSGASVTMSYELGLCEKPSPGNCCPASKIGDVINVFVK